MQHLRIMLIGDRGQVAWELQRSLATLGDLIIVGRSTSPYSLDLSEPSQILPLVVSIKPHLIINAAAYTSVDMAEQEEGLASAINGIAVGELAFAAKNVGALLVHYSTDYVFDGIAKSPYHEDAATNPQCAYGRSKLLGEEAINSSGVEHLIFRTSWVYGLRGNNFMRTIRRLGREREELRIVADQVGCPTWSRSIAEATAQVLSQLKLNKDLWSMKSGTYHLVSSGQASWYDFACEIIAAQKMTESIACERLVPIETNDYPLPAKRPSYSVMSTEKLFTNFGVQIPSWNSVLALVQNDFELGRL